MSVHRVPPETGSCVRVEDCLSVSVSPLDASLIVAYSGAAGVNDHIGIGVLGADDPHGPAGALIVFVNGGNVDTAALTINGTSVVVKDDSQTHDRHWAEHFSMVPGEDIADLEVRFTGDALFQGTDSWVDIPASALLPIDNSESGDVSLLVAIRKGAEVLVERAITLSYETSDTSGEF